MKIVYTKKFVKMFRGLPNPIQKLAIDREAIFRCDPFSKSLSTHKLKGDLTGYHAFSVNYNYRIIFRFVDGDVLFLLIGDHSIYE
jgi:mRNA-degrading endonuclease YafQ of YafQ-DinJ toxin-antitoxin module